jgi:hypothetical protein
MSINYSANALIGVELEYINDRNADSQIKGTSIAIPMKDDEPIEITIKLLSGDHNLKSHGGEMSDGRLYFGYLFRFDEQDSFQPNGVPLASVADAFSGVRTGLRELGYEGEVNLFCF